MKFGLPLPTSSIVGDTTTVNCLLRSVLDELEETGISQNRRSYGRHGVGGEMFRVSFAVLRKMG